MVARNRLVLPMRETFRAALVRTRLGPCNRKTGDDVSLTQSQCAELEQRLTELSRDVRVKIHDTAPRNADEKSLDRAGTTLDEGDEAVSNMEEDFKLTLQQRYRGELQQLEAVQERLASGEIDRCLDCAGDIGFQRLLANPLAVRCIRCQVHYEKTHAGTATPKL